MCDYVMRKTVEKIFFELVAKNRMYRLHTIPPPRKKSLKLQVLEFTISKY